MTKHVQVRLENADYVQLRTLCALRSCNQQTLLLEMIREYIQKAPEMKAVRKEK